MKSVLISASAAVMLAACGGGGGGSVPPQDATGIINIAITDAAVDNVDVVNVRFTGVTLKPQSGDEMVFEFDTPKDIDLLALQGGNTAELLSNEQVPVGPYNWLRLAVLAEFDNDFDSYAMMDDGTQLEIRVPSGSQSGLKLVSGFTVTQDNSTNIVIDWDLRKALSDPPGQPGLHLRPALRVTDMASFGTLNGTVDLALLEDATCTNDLVEDTGNAVYLYAGEVMDPPDISGADTDPVATATVSKGLDEIYRYEVSYLSVGEYTAALTCQASDDEVETEETIDFLVVTTGVMIANGETTELNFAAPAP